MCNQFCRNLFHDSSWTQVTFHEPPVEQLPSPDNNGSHQVPVSLQLVVNVVEQADVETDSQQPMERDEKLVPTVAHKLPGTHP
ncbi:hypothetical protein OGAPHI_006872 [Ogataea philodendri]|uniref:Uncharacterized protein n=1 Tax=Ogataea philodendri TaxID=1378263 RepID=A0A9P8SZC8_9ASCO|nr:uncharacterized protein OGAPHI_006872 [Ogataea philodendri]KAH3660286.1 hypothetical protein OGAPHI_006872 [Ogataea philodendri]